MSTYLLAIDQGTTNSRAILFNEKGTALSQHEIPLQQSFPHDGWVEQDPLEMFQNTVLCCQHAINSANIQAKEVAAIGITNQRETTIIWDKATGQPIYPAIVWQDRRTSQLCQQLSATAIGAKIKAKTGLLIDPYFSATKIMWLLDNIPHARQRAEQGELLFGTVDCYLLWRLTGGKVHATDATNAARTMLFNIHDHTWDAEILTALNIPTGLLPDVKDNASDFGETEQALLGAAIPIAGMAGDQQSATIGQACFQPGMLKATYGTGCFMLMNTGNKIVQSNNQLLATIAYRFDGKTTYGLEGSIFAAGVTVKWLRDTLQLIHTAQETESLASSVTDTGGVHLIPAFTGLGAPYWDPHARGAILGLTRNSNKAHIVRAALESVVYQSQDLLQAICADFGCDMGTLRVDGGMSANHWLLQFLSDILQIEVQRPESVEITALGAVYCAGLQIGLYHSLDDIAAHWQAHVSVQPNMALHDSQQLYRAWQRAVQRVLVR